MKNLLLGKVCMVNYFHSSEGMTIFGLAKALDCTDLICMMLVLFLGIGRQNLDKNLLCNYQWVPCPSCGAKLSDIKSTQRSDATTTNFFFSCSKRSCRKKISINNNTWFAGNHISYRKALILSYCFIIRRSIQGSINETSGLFFNSEKTSSETVVDHYSYCREVLEESAIAILT